MQKTTAQLTRAISSQMLLNSILRTDVMAFVRKTFDTVSPGDSFSANWHIEALCHQLSKVAAGQTRRLIITIPTPEINLHLGCVASFHSRARSEPPHYLRELFPGACRQARQ